MNRLALVPCLVVASYVAIAAFIASPILYELGRSPVGLKIPNSVANRGEVISSSFTKEAISAHPSNEVLNKPLAIIEKPAAAVALETPYQESTWVMVLLPARVHTGPSVDTPTIDFYPVGTPLRVRSYRPDWFEIIEPSTSKTGWIYHKYLGAISDSEQSKIASREAQAQTLVATQDSVPVKRYAKAERYAKPIPVKRYAKANRPSRQPITHGRTELASLLQRAFSGY